MFLHIYLFVQSHSHKCTDHIITTNINIDVYHDLFFIFISIFIHFAQACIYTARTFSSERVNARKAVWLLAVFRLAKSNTREKTSKVLYKPFSLLLQVHLAAVISNLYCSSGLNEHLWAKFWISHQFHGEMGVFILKEMQCSLPCLKTKRNNIK